MKKKIEVIFPPIASSNRDLDLVNLTKYLVENGFAKAYIGGLIGGHYWYGCFFENDVFVMRPYYWGECDCGWEEFFGQQKFENEEVNPHHLPDCYQTKLKKKKMENGWTETDLYGWLEPPKNMPYSKYEKIRKKIYKELTKEFGLPMLGCESHCTCGRDKRYKEWHNEKVMEFKNKTKIKPMDDEWLEGHLESCSLIVPNFHYKPINFQVRWYKWIGRDMEYSKEISDEEWKKIFKHCLESLKND